MELVQCFWKVSFSLIQFKTHICKKFILVTLLLNTIHFLQYNLFSDNIHIQHLRGSKRLPKRQILPKRKLRNIFLTKGDVREIPKQTQKLPLFAETKWKVSYLTITAHDNYINFIGIYWINFKSRKLYIHDALYNNSNYLHAMQKKNK